MTSCSLFRNAHLQSSKLPVNGIDIIHKTSNRASSLLKTLLVLNALQDLKLQYSSRFKTSRCQATRLEAHTTSSFKLKPHLKISSSSFPSSLLNAPQDCQPRFKIQVAPQTSPRNVCFLPDASFSSPGMGTSLAPSSCLLLCRGPRDRWRIWLCTHLQAEVKIKRLQLWEDTVSKLHPS
jgi:hypothetical protein